MPLSHRIWADPNSRRYLRKRSSVLPSGGRSGPDGRASHHPPGSHRPTGQRPHRLSLAAISFFLSYQLGASCSHLLINPSRPDKTARRAPNTSAPAPETSDGDASRDGSLGKAHQGDSAAYGHSTGLSSAQHRCGTLIQGLGHSARHSVFVQTSTDLPTQ